MVLSVKSSQSVEIFFFSSPEVQFEKSEIISSSKISEEEEFIKISLHPDILSGEEMTNLIISWNFKHVVVRKEGKEAPLLVLKLVHPVNINFFAVKLR